MNVLRRNIASLMTLQGANDLRIVMLGRLFVPRLVRPRLQVLRHGVVAMMVRT
jgi:hypothetical protein